MQTTGVKGYLLSVQQARLWALQGESQAYYAQCAVQLDGALDMAALLHALQSLVKRHEILRTVFHHLPGMETPVQVVTSDVKVYCPVIDLKDLSAVSQTAHLHHNLTNLQWKATNLEAGSPLFVELLHLSSDMHLLLICLPALCADGYTLTRIVWELSQIYVSFLRKEEQDGEPLQYADVAAWQDQLLKLEDGEGALQYWRKVDLSQLASLNLSFERKVSTKDDCVDGGQKGAFAPCALEVSLEESLAVQIKLLTQRYSVSIDAWLLACWEVALWRLGGKQDLLIGVACDGRNYEELAETLGLHTRFVPVNTQMRENLPFQQMVTSVNTSILQAIEWQTYFTWEGASASGTPASDSPPLFFPICFEYERWPASFVAEKMTFSLRQEFCCVEPFSLKLRVLQVGERLQLEFHYDSRRICITQLRQIVAVFQTLLEGAIAQPQASVSALPLLEPDERASLIALGCAATRPLLAQRLHQLFEEQAQRLPNQLAVISAQEHLTYQQLNERANQLAQVLQRRGVGPNVLVGLCLARNAQMLVGLVAILKAGGAYLPLDPESPPVRLIYQLQESQAVLVLTQLEVSMCLPEWGGRTLCLEELEQEISQASAHNLQGGSRTDDLAYVIYTSGSTGAPKGVMIQQGSVVNYTLALCELLRAEPGWQYATVSTLAADLGNTAIFCALASGGCVQVLDSETLISAEAMARWAEHYPIDVLKIVPSHLSALLTSERAKELVPKRALVLGGETVPVSLLKRLRELGGTCQIYNHYGPTETTVGVLVNELGRLDVRNEEGEEPQREQAWMTVPLGRPITNSEVYVLDDKMQLVPVGMTGELYLGGTGLAMGYIHQPEQTAEQFVPHPWSLQAGARLYRTGDLACYDDEGKIEFVGRRDRQVKLRGYRIELGEIEAVLRQHLQVWDCAVLLQEEGQGASQLIGYVVARTGSGLTSETLREILNKYVPGYMIPSSFVLLEALPLTSNGKVDWQQLPKPEQTLEGKPLACREPRGPIEEVLVEIWKELLGVPALGIYDNFFALGGHSLLATRLVARVRAVLQVELPVRAVFDAPTVVGLAQQVEQALRKGEEIAMPPLMAMERPEKIPLSFAQQRLWFLDQLEPGSPGYLRPSAHRLQGMLQVQYLEQSIEELVRRHESLRTTFALQEEQPVQVIHPASCHALPVIDLQGLRQEQREKVARRLASQEGQHPYDLEAGPLLRVYLLRLETQEHVVLLTLHHIITDGWSNEVLVRELTTLYHAFVTRLPASLAPLPIQYADYALWQRQWLQGEVLEAQLAYWRKQLAGVVPLDFPTDHPRPAEQTYRGAIQSQLLPRTLSEKLMSLSQQENVTLFMTLLAAFQVLLARYSGQRDIAVGTPIANRNHAEIEGVIGFFVNTLVLCTKLSGNPTFLNVLKRVREVALGAYAHQDIPFEKVVQELEPERDLSRSPLFQVMFVLQNAPNEQAELPGVSIKPLVMESMISKFDLTLSIGETGQGLHCSLEYNTDLFEAETITRMLGHWQTLLEGVGHNPQAHISDVPLLTESEREQLLVQWNATQTDYPRDWCVHQLFEQQVGRTSDAVAVVFKQEYLTYDELNRRANQLAHYLQEMGIGPDTVVGICMERSIEMVIGLLSILKAGGAYVPLDPTYPAERLVWILEEVQPIVVLTETHLMLTLSTAHTQFVCLDTHWQRLSYEPDTNPVSQVTAENLMYVIYTSGSMGKPKGVMNTHRGLCNRLCWMQDTYHLIARDRVVQKTPFSFDVSVWEFFWPLLTGAILIVARPDGHQDPAYLKALIAQQQVTILHFVPSMLQIFLLEPHLQGCESLRQVMCSGEALSPDLQAHFFAHFSEGVELHNLYGPTETAIDATFWQCQRESEGSRVPIGHPIANMQIYLLDEDLQPVPVGVLGELYIGGVGLARGYFKQADLTADKFTVHPFSQQAGERLYRTGDRARYQANGTIEFLGRVDHQVKLRGFRIELGEIEATLQTHPAVQEAVVILREEHEARKYLVAYVVARSGEPLSAEQLQGHLREQLPDYMVPARYVFLEMLPLMPNGKVDRRALPTPESTRPELREAFVGPRTRIESTLASIWSQVLRVEQVGIHDNFFALGGDSILSIQVVARAKQAGLHLTPRLLFQYQSIAQLCSVVTTSEPPSGEQALVTGPVPLTPIQHWFFGRHLPESHHFNQALLLETSLPLRLGLLQQALEHLVLHHDALRLRFVHQAGRWQQDIAEPSSHPSLLCIDLSALPYQEQESVMAKLAEVAQASLNLRAGLLLRALCFAHGSGSCEHLLLIIHHLGIDGVSWRILLEDLETLSGQLSQGKPMRLAAKTTSWQQWAQLLGQYAQSQELRSEQIYWSASLREQVMPLPVDRPLGSNTVATCATVNVALDAEHTQALLQEVLPAYHMQINAVLLTALVQAFAQWTGQRRLLVDLEGHGREEIAEDVDLSRTVGWFTTQFPVVLDIEQAMGPAEALKTIKEQLRQVPQKGLGYGLLRYLNLDRSVTEALANLQEAEVVFNYLGQFDSSLHKQSLFHPAHGATRSTHSPLQPRSHLLEINACVVGGHLQVSWQYSQAIHHPETIQGLAQHFIQALADLIAHCRLPQVGGYTPSDFPLAALNQPQLDRLIQQLPQAEVGRPDQQIEDIYPLSPMQAGLLFQSLYTPEAGVYCVQFGWTMQGPLNREAWQWAWQQVINRHAVLRTLFVWQGLTQPLQVVCRHIEIPWEVYDWRSLSVQEQQHGLETLRQEHELTSLDLGRAPLVRLVVARLGEQTSYVHLSVHHLIIDGWSQPLLFAEVQECYQAFYQEREPRLASVRPYRDYLAWLQRQDTQQAELFWRKYLAGFSTPNRLPGHSAASSTVKVQMAIQHLECSAQLTSALQERARQEQLTLNTLLQGVWALLLSYYSGEQDVVFGATTAGRPAELRGVETMVGVFINTLPVRLRIVAAIPLSAWLGQLQAQQVEARQYEYVPLAQIQAWSEVPAGQALFESLVIFQNYPVETFVLEPSSDLAIEQVYSVEQTHYPLLITIIPRATGLTILLQYDQTRLEGILISQMLHHLHILLQTMAEQPRQRLGDLSLLSEQERHQLQVQWNATHVDFPQEICVHQLFEQQVQHTPEAVAVVCEQASLTYEQLNQRANQLAHHLHTLGVEPEVLVGVCMERSLNLVIALVAILKAGGVYVPLDPAYPVKRLDWMLEHIQPAVLLTQQSVGLTLSCSEVQQLCLDTDGHFWSQEPSTNLVSPLIAENLAYIIYTSGSTGMPKGAMVLQSGMLNHLVAKIADLQLSEQDRIAQTASLCFDISVWQFLAGLLVGGCTVIYGNEVVAQPALLVKGIRLDQISIFETVPSFLRAMLESSATWPQAERSLPTLRWLIPTGEALAWDLCHKWFDSYPDIGLVNAYGPTECSDDVTHYPLREAPASRGVSVPIGRPVNNMRMYVLDHRLMLTPIGTIGELYIGGVGVGRGYLKDPQRTAEAFVPDPFALEAGMRLYKTGDLVRYQLDGTIEFLGRVDQQVKIRGFRIELAEIEATLMKHPAIREVVVQAQEDMTGEKYLMAYIVVQQEKIINMHDLQSYLQNHLPAYMIPSSLTLLDALPLTPNGKVDRQALPKPDDLRPELEVPFVPPRTLAEEVVAAIWAEVLQVQHVGVYDNFFELGGHSLRAVQIISRLHDAFQIELPLRSLFERPTIDSLVNEIAQLRGGREVVEEIALVFKEIEQLSEDDVQNILSN